MIGLRHVFEVTQLAFEEPVNSIVVSHGISSSNVVSHGVSYAILVIEQLLGSTPSANLVKKSALLSTEVWGVSIFAVTHPLAPIPSHLTLPYS